MVTLLTIQHDPGGKLLEPLHKALPLIDDLFDKCYLTITPTYPDDAYPFLIYDYGWQIKWDHKKGGMAEARRSVIKLALKESKDNYYFYCDLDRLIHWATIHPTELRETVLQVQNKDYTVIGRKYFALQSHPLFQFETETVMNKIVREVTGLDMDVFAGARCFSYQAAKWISEQSIANHAAQDIEWPLIVKDNGGTIGYVEVSGLAYESAALDIRHSREDEIKLRVKNLKSVLEFLE